MELSDKEWKIIEPLLPELPSGKRGRPWRDNREVLEGDPLGDVDGSTLARYAKRVSTLSNLPSSFSTMAFGWFL